MKATSSHNYPPQVTGYKGKYKIESELGSGGFGVACLATIIDIIPGNSWITRPGPKIGDKVVLKWANTQNTYSEEDNIIFINVVNAQINNELYSLHKLSEDECVAKIFDLGSFPIMLEKSPQNVTFLVEEYLFGTLFDDYLLNMFGIDEDPGKKFEGIKNSDEFIRLAIKLATVVRQMHYKGIIHGDIWPKNIMVMENEKIQFFDLGAATIRSVLFLRPHEFDKLRNDSYIAPERKSGERHGRRSDIFSIGGTFFYMATGQYPPKPIMDIDELKKTIVTGINKINPILLKENFGISDIIARCLRYNKDERIRDADSLLNELRLFTFQLGTNNARKDKVENYLELLLGKKKSQRDLYTRMIEVDLGQLIKKVNDIKQGIFEVSGDHENLVFSMSSYLSVLSKGDHLLARTTPRFWDRMNMGINGRFLSMIQLIVQRGVSVKHIIMVCESEKFDPSLNLILNAHNKVSNLVKNNAFGKCISSEYLVYCKIVSEEIRKEEIRKSEWERCYSISRNSIKAIHPVFDGKNVLRTLRFVRQKKSIINRIKKELENEILTSVKLDEWLK